MQLQQHIALAPYTTFGIGGPAQWFAEAASEDDILTGVRFAHEHRIPLFILGGGSNLLVSDNGFPGLVLRIVSRGLSLEPRDGLLSIHAAAGEDWDELVVRTIAEDAAGMECLSGIPGLVGGTPVQNVGAYGQEVSDTITQVRAFDLQTSSFVTLSSADCRFSYRRSIFNTPPDQGGAPGRYIVTEVTYRLRLHGAPNLAYADLQRWFANSPSPPTLATVRAAVRSIRASKGMLLQPEDPDSRSAGSFFKNPVVPAALYQELAARLPREKIPNYPAAPGALKIPAAWLIERAGFKKGFALGPAAISSKHTLALVNRGAARAADILALRDHIAAQVRARFGIQLEPEPVYLQ